MSFAHRRLLLLKGNNSGGSGALPEQVAADAFSARVLADGGVYEADACNVARIKNLMDLGLWDQASLVLLPHGVKANKLYSLKPADGSGDFPFTRAGTKTRVNSSDAVVTVATGVPSLDYENSLTCPELKIEKASTNLFLNSETLSTQGVSTSAIAYTVSFKGTGTITFSGAYVGTLVGTGATDVVSKTFTPTAGTVTCTVTGSVKYANFEPGTYATSWITTTSGTVTRIADAVTALTGVSSLIGQTEGTLYSEWSSFADATSKGIGVSDGTISNRILILLQTNNTIRLQITTSGASQVAIVNAGFTTGTIYKVAATYQNNKAALFINGVKIGEDLTVSVPTCDTVTLTDGGASSTFYGYINNMSISKIAISDTEAIALTTP